MFSLICCWVHFQVQFLTHGSSEGRKGSHCYRSRCCYGEPTCTTRVVHFVVVVAQKPRSSNEALGTRVAIVEVRGDFEPVVQYASAGVSLCSLFAVCWSSYVHVYAVFWDFCLEQMSCKSFLKLQVVIISLDAFQVFCEARVNTRSPLFNGSTTACSKTSAHS